MKKTAYRVLINQLLIIPCLIFICNSVSAQQDKHIDPSPYKTTYNLTFAKHINTQITQAEVDALIQFGNDKLQKCDNRTSDDQDVACQVTFKRSGSLATFGTAADGLDEIDDDLIDIIIDIITNGAETSQVHDQPQFVKIVTAIVYNGSILNGIAKDIGSSSMILARTNPAVRPLEQMGVTFVHEFGHCQGLYHRQHPDEPGNPYPLIGAPIMASGASGVANRNEVNFEECEKFHNGYNSGIANKTVLNRPVDILFLIDDTGSMSEEIGGVRDALTKVLNDPTFASNPCSGKVFQLVTYKDAPDLSRHPTTDINVIKSQVAALVASGGGDCPEASQQAFEAIKEKIKDGGQIHHYTDASPHPGTDIAGVTAALKARSIKVNSFVTGDCSSTTFRTTEGSSPDIIPVSNNNDPGWTASSTAFVTLPPGAGAVAAFSYMSEETGGIFTFIPEVNSGQPADITRFENLSYNIIIGGIIPAVISLQPLKGPAGGTLAVTINGSGTHFDNTTGLAFSDAGITISNVSVVSPTKISATITIAPGVSLGFKDITAISQPAGSTETARGLGVLEVTVPPVFPTVLSVSPASGKAGETLTVKVTGINTSFAAGSVLTMGSGINVLSLTAISATELDAQVQISPTAALGFRNVTVTTGAQTATENVPGPFLVVAADCIIPVLNDLPPVCVNAAVVDLSPFASPTGGSFSGTGVSGNLFNPAVAGAGTHTISYLYDSAGTCSTVVSKTIIVHALPVATIASSTPDNFCNKLTLTAGSTSTGPFMYEWKTGNTFFAAVPAIQLGNEHTNGTYNVWVTDGNGCVSAAPAAFNYIKENTISNYTILALKKSHLDDNNDVESGSAGVVKNNGTAEFHKHCSVTAPGAFVKAKNILTEYPVTIPNRIYAPVTVTLPAMQYNTANLNGLPSYTVNQNTTVTLNGNYKELLVKKGANVTLNGTIFGKISVQEKAQVTFTQPEINIRELLVDKGTGTSYTYVRFATDANVRVSRHVKIQEKARVNPEEKKVTFYLGDTPCDEQKFMVKANDTRVTANVYIPEGRLRIVAANSSSCGGYSSSTQTSYMKGLFIAEHVDGEGKNIVWNSYQCMDTYVTGRMHTGEESNEEQNRTSPIETVVPGEAQETASALSVTASPNPSMASFTLRVTSALKDGVTIRITDASGRPLEWKTGVQPGSAVTMGHTLASGIYYAEVIQGKERKVVKLVKIK